MNTKIDRPHPGDILTVCFETINARGGDYDNVASLEENFREAAAVASLITGKTLDARDIALVLHSVKLIRSKSAPDKLDNYVDGASYMAFAACFAGLVPLPSPVKSPPTPHKTKVPAPADLLNEPA